ncbi:MAG: hypothetical protein IKE41_04235 [Clostridia bacterium]|nr:hypothetical protein [Clostridia bacterium]
MFSLKKILLLTSFLFELIFAEDNENLYDFNYRIQKTEIDSTEIYERMIFQEQSKASATTGQILLGFGIPLTIGGGIAIYKSATFDDNEQFNTAVFGIPLAIIGVPMIIYGIYDIAKSKSHNQKQEELKKQYFYYKYKKQATQFFIAPFIGLHAQAGINLFAKF